MPGAGGRSHSISDTGSWADLIIILCSAVCSLGQVFLSLRGILGERGCVFGVRRGVLWSVYFKCALHKLVLVLHKLTHSSCVLSQK